VTVATIDQVRIRCYVGHEEVAQIKVGQVARVQTGSSGGNPSGALEGTVTRVAMSADPETMLFLVEVLADNPGDRLRPGSVAALSVLVEEKGRVLVSLTVFNGSVPGSFGVLATGGDDYLCTIGTEYLLSFD